MDDAWRRFGTTLIEELERAERRMRIVPVGEDPGPNYFRRVCICWLIFQRRLVNFTLIDRDRTEKQKQEVWDTLGDGLNAAGTVLEDLPGEELDSPEAIRWLTLHTFVMSGGHQSFGDGTVTAARNTLIAALENLERHRPGALRLPREPRSRQMETWYRLVAARTCFDSRKDPEHFRDWNRRVVTLCLELLEGMDPSDWVTKSELEAYPDPKSIAALAREVGLDLSRYPGFERLLQDPGVSLPGGP